MWRGALAKAAYAAGIREQRNAVGLARQGQRPRLSERRQGQESGARRAHNLYHGLPSRDVRRHGWGALPASPT